jgi:hypothetical protein
LMLIAMNLPFRLVKVERYKTASLGASLAVDRRRRRLMQLIAYDERDEAEPPGGARTSPRHAVAPPAPGTKPVEVNRAAKKGNPASSTGSLLRADTIVMRALCLFDQIADVNARLRRSSKRTEIEAAKSVAHGSLDVHPLQDSS